MKKIAVITCYKDPDYIRAVTLRKAAKQLVGYDYSEVKNKNKGLFRYVEVTAQLIRLRFTVNPDTYLITFRGYEILPVVLLAGLGKKIIYDEFINPLEWLFEHSKLSPESKSVGLFRWLYRQLLKPVKYIITDTESHATYSANLIGYDRLKITSIPVGTDQTRFKPVKNKADKHGFTVLYYGSMLPLHGLEYVCGAALSLSGNAEIKFLLIGGSDKDRQLIESFKAKGANIDYINWVPFEKLKEYIYGSSLCLGGPFGGTLQGDMVITGKTYQSLACGVATVVGKNQESAVFDDQKNALIVDQANSKSLTDCILWAYKNQNKLDTIGTNGRKLFDEKFSEQFISKKLNSVLERN
jgi:glycosyltransferase involved in cell wall biosynthesis